MYALWRRDEVSLFDAELTSRVKANRDYMMSLSRENLMLHAAHIAALLGKRVRSAMGRRRVQQPLA